MAAIPTLHFFCGKAGAGKTTVAQAVAQDTGAFLISEDIWMARLFGDQMTTFQDYIHFSRKLKTVVGPLVVDLLKSGQSVVLDFQANTRAGRAWFRSLFEEAGSDHRLHYVDTPDAECLARIARRNEEQPEGSHPLTEDDFNHISSFFAAPEEAENFAVVMHPI
jgi:predicted kinase